MGAVGPRPTDHPLDRARAVVLPLPIAGGLPRFELARLLPSVRSLALGFGLLAALVGSYFGAREGALFAIERIEIEGAPPALARDVRQALDPLRETNLLALEEGEVATRLSGLPLVRSVTYDRAFPHTLRIFVAAERSTGVLRRGAESWLVSAEGRVLARTPRGTHSDLPRVWVPAGVTPRVGATLGDGDALRAARAFGALAAGEFPARVLLARSSDEELTLILRSGTEIRLGTEAAVDLKLAVAGRVLVALRRTDGVLPRYVDVAVPERPLTPENPQVAS